MPSINDSDTIGYADENKQFKIEYIENKNNVKMIKSIEVIYDVKVSFPNQTGPNEYYFIT